MEAIIKQYSIIIETMEEVHQTTHDEYGLKSGGIIVHVALEKFEIFFWFAIGLSTFWMFLDIIDITILKLVIS